MDAAERGALADAVERELGPMLSAARMPIFVLWPSGQLITANAAALEKYGYTRASLEGLSIQDLIAEPRDIRGEIENVLSDRPVPLVRRPHRTRDGTELSVLPSAFPLTIAGERLIVSFIQDVTALDAAEAEARRAHAESVEHEQRTKGLRAELLAAERLASIGRVAAGIAHEVNNPAALVTVNLRVLRERLGRQGKPLDREDLLPMLDDSLEAMERIRDIVHHVRGFARDLPSEEVDLSRLAANVVRMVQFDGRRRPTVDTVLEPDVFARVRSSRLSQVLTNLLINAAQAIPDTDTDPSAAPHILLRTFRAGPSACIEVSDTGPGVPAHLGERIFDPFFTTRSGSGGTGLGLWLARGMVEDEGGTLTLALEERPGAGAVFRVSLPGPAPGA